MPKRAAPKRRFRLVPARAFFFDVCEKDLGENICSENLHSGRHFRYSLILQEASGGLDRAARRWRNARKPAAAKASQPGVKGSVGCGGRFFAGYLWQAAKFRMQPPSALNQVATAAASAKLILWDVLASSI